MSNTVAVPQSLPPYENGIDPTKLKLIVKKPSLLVPIEVRPALLECWMAHKSLKDMETALPIAVLISVWMSRYGLQSNDAIDILLAMQSPEYVGAHNFTNELTADLAKRASAVIERRKQAKIQQERAEQEQREKAERAPQEDINEALRLLRESAASIPAGMRSESSASERANQRFAQAARNN